MQAAVARDDIGRGDIEARTVHVADVTTRLYNHQRASRDVPLLKTKFPETIHSSARYVGEIEGSRSSAPHALGAHHKGLPEGEIVAAAFTAIVWKAGGEQ